MSTKDQPCLNKALMAQSERNTFPSHLYVEVGVTNSLPLLNWAVSFASGRLQSDLTFTRKIVWLSYKQSVLKQSVKLATKSENV